MSSSTLARRWVGFGGGRLLVAPSILALAVASAAAVYAWPFLRDPIQLCDERVLGAGHINLAVGLVLACGFFGTVALLVLRSYSHMRSVAVTQLVLAVLVGISVALVWSASGAYAIHFPSGVDPGDMVNCSRDKPLTEIESVWYLYPVWGGAVALLLLQAVRAFGYVRFASEREAEEG